jgi:NADH dehydrogenase (ubiquinone) 1 alpha/beta subcomplex 1, acyl-carrier protein
MFRTAILRTSASVARVALRPAARRTMIAAASPRIGAASAVIPKLQTLRAVRLYSAGGSLNKEEVEGRIMSLLQGFDKVSIASQSLPPLSSCFVW